MARGPAHGAAFPSGKGPLGSDGQVAVGGSHFLSGSGVLKAIKGSSCQKSFRGQANNRCKGPGASKRGDALVALAVKVTVMLQHLNEMY